MHAVVIGERLPCATRIARVCILQTYTQLSWRSNEGSRGLAGPPDFCSVPTWSRAGSPSCQARPSDALITGKLALCVQLALQNETMPLCPLSRARLGASGGARTGRMGTFTGSRRCHTTTAALPELPPPCDGSLLTPPNNLLTLRAQHLAAARLARGLPAAHVSGARVGLRGRHKVRSQLLRKVAFMQRLCGQHPHAHPGLPGAARWTAT